MLFTDVSSTRAVKAFEKVGFRTSSTVGKKHIGMTNGRLRIIVPRHARLNPYMLKGIIRDAGLTEGEFKKLI